jgi:hypothetical protein
LLGGERGDLFFASGTDGLGEAIGLLAAVVILLVARVGPPWACRSALPSGLTVSVSGLSSSPTWSTSSFAPWWEPWSAWASIDYALSWSPGTGSTVIPGV